MTLAQRLCSHSLYSSEKYPLYLYLNQVIKTLTEEFKQAWLAVIGTICEHLLGKGLVSKFASLQLKLGLGSLMNV
jgi:hypothetical protein